MAGRLFRTAVPRPFRILVVYFSLPERAKESLDRGVGLRWFGGAIPVLNGMLTPGEKVLRNFSDGDVFKPSLDDKPGRGSTKLLIHSRSLAGCFHTEKCRF